MHSPSSISLLIVVPGGSQFSGGEEEGVDAVIVGIGLVVGFGLVNNVIPVSCETVDSIKGGKVDPG